MKYQILLLGVLIFALIGCEVKSKKNTNKVKVPQKKILKKVESKKAKRTYLDDKNAIPFLTHAVTNNVAVASSLTHGAHGVVCNATI